MSASSSGIEHRRDWFAVERRVFDDEMFAGDEFSRREAWLWLIANAAKRNHNAHTRGGVVSLKRGEVIIGRDYLSKVWGWTPSRVRTYLDQLREADRLIFRQSNGHHPNVAKVNNYGRFQDVIAKPSPVESPDDRQSIASGSPHPYKEQGTVDSRGSTPLTRIASMLSTADCEVAEGAIADFNIAAAEMRFSRATVTLPRVEAVAARLRDIGKGDVHAGRDRWLEALSAIGHDAYLSGRMPAKPPYKTGYKLTLEKFLRTDGKMGDVIGRLLDLHGEHGPAVPQPDATEAVASFSDAWREAQELELAEQRARYTSAPDQRGGHDAFH